MLHFADDEPEPESESESEQSDSESETEQRRQQVPQRKVLDKFDSETESEVCAK